jgi:hypothetical protein
MTARKAERWETKRRQYTGRKTKCSEKLTGDWEEVAQEEEPVSKDKRLVGPNKDYNLAQDDLGIQHQYWSRSNFTNSK